MEYLKMKQATNTIAPEIIPAQSTLSITIRPRAFCTHTTITDTTTKLHNPAILAPPYLTLKRGWG